MHKVVRNLIHSTCTFPTEGEPGDALPSCWAYTVNKCPSCSLFSAPFLIFLCLVLVTFLFIMCPMCSAAMLPGVPQGKRLWRAFTKKVCVFDKLLSDTSYSAVGVSSMLIYQQHILNKVTLKRNTENKVMYWSIEENVTKACRNLTLHFP